MGITGVEDAEEVAVPKSANVRECLIKPGLPAAGDHAEIRAVATLRRVQRNETQQSGGRHVPLPSQDCLMSGPDDKQTTHASGK